MSFNGELYNIKAIEVVPSVMRYGILSNEEVRRRKIPYTSIAMKAIQEKRDGIRVPNGLRLHNYANLYFHARNPMMFKLQGNEHLLCVLTISSRVLDISGVVLADHNASSTYVRFLTPDQIDEIDFEKVYAKDWRHPNNGPAYYAHKSKKCAEVLVPHCVPPEYIKSAHVVDKNAKAKLEKTGFTQHITISPDMFFC